MASVVTRINLTGPLALAVEAVSQAQGISQAEVVRQTMKQVWGENLEKVPTGSPGDKLNGSPCHPVTLSPTSSPVPVSRVSVPCLDDLFKASA